MATTTKRYVFRWRRPARAPGWLREEGTDLTCNGEVIGRVRRETGGFARRTTASNDWYFFATFRGAAINSLWEGKTWKELDEAKAAAVAWAKGE